MTARRERISLSQEWTPVLDNQYKVVSSETIYTQTIMDIEVVFMYLCTYIYTYIHIYMYITMIIKEKEAINLSVSVHEWD